MASACSAVGGRSVWTTVLSTTTYLLRKRLLLDAEADDACLVDQVGLARLAALDPRRRCEHNTIRLVVADGSWQFPNPTAVAADQDPAYAPALQRWSLQASSTLAMQMYLAAQ